MQAFHEEIQRRLDAEANLRRQLAQAHRRLKANARKAARKEDESKLAYARQSNVIRHLNFSLNEAHLQIQELQRQDRSAFLRGRVRGGRLRRGGKKSSASVRKSHSDVGVKTLSVKELVFQAGN